jgi:hypothetical protein
LSEAVLSAAAQNRKLLLSYKGLVAHATRYDKLARNFLAAATLIGALYWIKLCVQTLVTFAIVEESAPAMFDGFGSGLINAGRIFYKLLLVAAGCHALVGCIF